MNNTWLRFESTLRVVSIALCLTSLIGACTSEQRPTRHVQLGNGMLDMQISEDWKLEANEEERRVYSHASLEGVRLHISTQIDDIGSPLQVVHVKALVGKELNLEFGGVRTRVSLGGNAMMEYSREVLDEDDVALFAQEWVIAKPVGYGEIARVLISMQIPAEAQSDRSIPGMIEVLDKQVGDARIPRA